MIRNRERHLAEIEKYFRMVTESHVDEMTDAERAELLAVGLRTVDAATADVVPEQPPGRHNPRESRGTMRDIVDRNAARVSTKHINLPLATVSMLQKDLDTVRQLVEAGRANREATTTAVTTILKTMIGVAALAL